MRTHRPDHENTPARSDRPPAGARDLAETAPAATPGASPLINARIAGSLYLVIVVFGLFGELALRSILVHGDAAATAENLRDSASLVRAVVATSMAYFLCEAALTVILYLLLRPVNSTLSLLAAAFRLVSLPIYAVNLLTVFAALLIAGDGAAGGAESLALFLFDLHKYGYAIGLVFFGVNCLIMGRLVFTSTHLPRSLGVLLSAAGVGYLVDNFMYVLVPGYDGGATAPLLAPALVAETWFCLLLLWKGGGMDEWEERFRR